MRKSLEDRFWPKLAKGGSNECWEWQANKNNMGYGMLRNGSQMYLAHRVSWEHVGNIVRGQSWGHLFATERTVCHS